MKKEAFAESHEQGVQPSVSGGGSVVTRRLDVTGARVRGLGAIGLVLREVDEDARFLPTFPDSSVPAHGVWARTSVLTPHRGRRNGDSPILRGAGEATHPTRWHVHSNFFGLNAICPDPVRSTTRVLAAPRLATNAAP